MASRNTERPRPADTPSSNAGAHAAPEDHVAAGQRRADAVASLEGLDQRARNEVLGLLEARRGFVTRGLTDRVAQVDVQLQIRGYAGGE